MDSAPPAARLSLAEGRDVAGRILGRLQREESALRLAVTGALRRMEPTVARIDLLATAHEPEHLLAAFTDPAVCAEVTERGPDHACVRRKEGALALLRVLPTDDTRFFPLLVDRTGNAAHVAALAERARAKGLRLEPEGLYREAERLAVRSEEDLYDRLGVPWRPPELREDGDLSAPPADLLTMGDVRGLMTVRLTEGSPFSLHDLVARAAQEGYRWVVVDASQDEVEEATRDLEADIRVFRTQEVGALTEIREGSEPDPHWHAEQRARCTRVATTARIERPSDLDKLIAAVGAARRGRWRKDEVLNALDADGFAAWCEASR